MSCLTLIKAVLEAISVYWMSLAWIPKGILKRIQQICCRFLWRGQNSGKTLAWVSWDEIAKTKKLGGWGIKNLQLFSRALAAKMDWVIINSRSLWQEVMYFKYIHLLIMMDWICRPNFVLS